MKTICWTILGAMVAVSALADAYMPPAPGAGTNAAAPAATVAPTASPTPIVTPAPAPTASEAPNIGPTLENTNLPPKAVHKRRHVAAPAHALNEPTVTLAPGPAEVGVPNLNVRGQPGLRGEYITHLHQGEPVTVLSQINLDKHKPGEPAQWAKIAYPSNAPVWVLARFIGADKTVTPKKLNLRAGPGENYSVVGTVDRGTPVTEISQKENWMRIEPPQNAYAFVAAMYLKQESTGTMAANVEPSTETEMMTTNAVGTEPTLAEAPVDTNAPAMMDTNVPALTDTNLAEVDTNLPPPPPRRVTHEGFVRHVHSIIEPTAYELYDLKTGADIDYLYTTDTNLDISAYNDRHIVVTGTEALDPRWTKTPVLTVEKIVVVE